MSKEVKAYVGLVLTFVLWGSLYVVSSVVLKYLPTFTVMLARFIIAFIALSIIIKVKSRNWKDGKNEQGKKTSIDKTGMKYVIIMGVFGYGITVGIQLMGTKLAGSSLASLINSLNPVTISLMAIPILHEKLTINKAIGIVLAVFGVYMILGMGGSINLAGVVLSLLSVLGWSLVSVLTRQGLAHYEPLVITRNAIGVASIVEVIFAIAEALMTHPAYTINLTVIVGLIYLGVLCTGIAYILWNQALAALPASNCSALYPLQPLTSTLMGILLFNETVGMSFIMGSVCIIIGVLIVLLGERLRHVF